MGWVTIPNISIEYNWINIPCLDSAGWCGVLAGPGRTIQGNTKRGTETRGVQHAWTVLSQSVCQWEFQDPKMEVLYHIRPYFVGIFPYIGLIDGRYLQFRFLRWPVSMPKCFCWHLVGTATTHCQHQHTFFCGIPAFHLPSVRYPGQGSCFSMFLPGQASLPNSPRTRAAPAEVRFSLFLGGSRSSMTIYNYLYMSILTI